MSGGLEGALPPPGEVAPGARRHPATWRPGRTAGPGRPGGRCAAGSC